MHLANNLVYLILVLDIAISTVICYNIRDDPPSDVALMFFAMFAVVGVVLMVVFANVLNPV